MLQFLLQPNDKYSLAEAAQIAVEGGCKWIQVHCPDMDEAELRTELEQIIPLCKESATILMLEDRIDLARDLGLHGVHLRDRDVSPGKVREELGPEAIIGVEIVSAQAAAALKGLDIDYATVAPELSSEEREKLIETVRSCGVELPIVAQGDFDVEEAAVAVALGASGVCTGHKIIEAEDPVAYTELMLSALTK